MALQDYINKYERLDSTTKIRARRANFIFLTDGSMVYDYDKFSDCNEAIVDAVVNHGEDLIDMLNMTYSQYYPRLVEQFKEEIRKLKDKQFTTTAI